MKKLAYISLFALLALIPFPPANGRVGSSAAAVAPAVTPARRDFPELAVKPKPKWWSSSGWSCPPEGNGGDSDLSRLKNRIDHGSYLPVTLDDIRGIEPQAPFGKEHRADWTQAQKDAVSPYEGTPVSVEGYLALVKNEDDKIEGAREEGKESCNCKIDTLKFHDFHIWLLDGPPSKSFVPTPGRVNAVVVEATPPVRVKRPGWTVAALTDIANRKQKVRMSGWLLYDQEHPEQLGKTRATLWEVHPIIKIEYRTASGWKELK